MNIHEVRARLAELKAEADRIVEKATTEGRDLTAEEDERLEAIKTEAPKLRQLEAKLDQERQIERAFAEVEPEDVRISGGTPRVEQDPQRGWTNAGEFFLAVRRAAAPGGQAVVDERLGIGAAPTSFGNEGAAGDGAVLVPPAFSTRIMDYSLEGEAFLPMTDNIPITGNSMRMPTDETTPWGATGPTGYWEAEAAQATQSKPDMDFADLRLHKLFALVPMTDELLADAPAAEAHVERKTGQAIRWKSNDAVVNGTGAGQPLGFANENNGALVTQAKEGSQAADTINANNVAKMFARNLMPGRAVWLVNPDAFNQLPVMTIGDQPVFTSPSAGVREAPNGLLLGRPVFMTDSCQTLGDAGDIYFVDLMSYLSITKTAGIQRDTSIHLWFDYDVTAFRAIFRVDGQPWAKAPITPPNSAVTRSGFVRLAARA